MTTRQHIIPAHLQGCLDGLGYWVMEHAADLPTPAARRQYVNAAVNFVEAVTKFAACPNDNLLEHVTQELQAYWAAYMRDMPRPTV